MIAQLEQQGLCSCTLVATAVEAPCSPHVWAQHVWDCNMQHRTMLCPWLVLGNSLHAACTQLRCGSCCMGSTKALLLLLLLLLGAQSSAVPCRHIPHQGVAAHQHTSAAALQWIPPHERARAVSLTTSGEHLRCWVHTHAAPLPPHVACATARQGTLLRPAAPMTCRGIVVNHGSAASSLLTC